MTKTVLSILLLATAAPALAQYGAPATSSATQVSTGPTQESAAPATTTAAPAGPQAKPSKGAVKALIALQSAYKANDAAAIAAALPAANAAATTADDRYIIAQFALNRAVAAKDNAGMASAIDAIGKSGFLPSARVAELYVALGSTLYQAKQFGSAGDAFEHGLALNPNDESLLANLAETRYSEGKQAEAVGLMQRLIQTTESAGQKPAENVYKRAVSVAYASKSPLAIDLGRKWIAAYPSPDSWHNGLAIYQNYNKPDVEPVLGLLRLMRATSALTNVADYNLYSTAAAEQGNYTEAQAVIDEGLAKNAFPAGSAVMMDVIAGLKTKQKPTAADLEAATKSASTAQAFLRIGDRYYGMGNYAKAAELYRTAAGKGGADSSLVQLHLGMALARQGDKAGALDALGKVNGELAPIAGYWKLYAQQAA